MSSPDQSIPLRHQPDDKGYRLIELPPELHSLLQSDTAPVLTLESSDSSAILKSPTQSYALRQKNTSNSLLLLSSRPQHPGAVAELVALSTVKETVELQAMPQGPVGDASVKHTGSKGRWHERFGTGR